MFRRVGIRRPWLVAAMALSASGILGFRLAAAPPEVVPPVDLGTLGGSQSQALGLNNAGAVVGYSYVAGNLGGHAFVWTEDAGMRDLGTLGGPESQAWDINESGTVVGWSFAGNGGERAFRWSDADGMRDLGSLGGGDSVAYAVNEAGAVVGRSSPPDYWGHHAFVWTEADGMRDLGTLGGSMSAAFGINDAGAVTGWSTTLSGEYHAFLWTDAEGMQDLGTLGGPDSFAYDVNNAEAVVGRSYTAYGEYHAFLWTRESGMHTLGTLGGLGSLAYGINDAGAVVGFSHVPPDPANPNIRHAFLWTEAEGMQDLGTLGGDHSQAFGVNDAGAVVGDSLTAGNLSSHAALWPSAVTPNTEPGTGVPVTSTTTLPDGSTASVSTTFDTVVDGGETSVTTSDAGPPPPSGFKLTNPPVYYDITTTATFEGSVRVCLSWSEGQISNESNVKMFHQEAGQWVDITDVDSIDTVNNIVCGTASSLSPFTLFEVKFAFGGFLPPIDAEPTANAVKAGSSVPVKFSLGGNQGLEIFAPGYPRSALMQCVTGNPISDMADTVAPGSSGLIYDPDTDRYTYVWKTDSAWSYSCRRLELTLADGETYTARFTFRR